MIGYRVSDKHQPHGFGFDIRAQPKEVMIIAPLKYQNEDDDFVKRRKKDYAEAKAKREKDQGLIDMSSLLDKDRK